MTGVWPDTAQDVLSEPRPAMRAAGLLHTHPDVVGVDVVGSGHSVVHITQSDTGGINWEGKAAAQVSRGDGGKKGPHPPLCLWTPG